MSEDSEFLKSERVAGDSDSVREERKGERRKAPWRWMGWLAPASPISTVIVAVVFGVASLQEGVGWAFWLAVFCGFIAVLITIGEFIHGRQLAEHRTYRDRVRAEVDARDAATERHLVDIMNDGLATWANVSLPLLMRDVSNENAEKIQTFLVQYAFDVLMALHPGARLRAHVYILDYRDEKLDSAANVTRSIENAILSSSGAPLGRRNSSSRRAEFTIGSGPGKETLSRILDGTTIICDDIKTSGLYGERGRPYSYSSFISVPLDTDGEIRGMISCDSDEVSTFTRRDESLLLLPAQMLGWTIASQSVKPGGARDAGQEVMEALRTKGLIEGNPVEELKRRWN